MDNMIQFPETGFLRLTHIVGDKKKGFAPIYPVSKSTWWLGVKEGRFPQPVKLGPKTTAWRVDDIRNLCASTAQEGK